MDAHPSDPARFSAHPCRKKRPLDPKPGLPNIHSGLNTARRRAGYCSEPRELYYRTLVTLVARGAQLAQLPAADGKAAVRREQWSRVERYTHRARIGRAAGRARRRALGAQPSARPAAAAC